MQKKYPYLFFFSLLITLILFGFPWFSFAAPGTSSLVGYWKLDETANDTCGGGEDACDSSGYDNDGTESGGATISADVPSVNFTNTRSRDFDGTGDIIDVGDIDALDFDADDPFSISVWIKPEGLVSYGIVVGKGANGNPSWYLGDAHTTSSVWFDYFDGVNYHQVSSGAGTVSRGDWHHIVYVQDGSNNLSGRFMYVDGVDQSNRFDGGSPNSAANAFPLQIGALGGGTLYEGGVDDVRIYNRALSADEVADLAAGDHTSATWDGSSSTNYETGANWDMGAMPDPYTNVTVADVTNQPILTVAEELASLTINSGATIDLDGNNLTINDGGDFTNEGTLIIDNTETLTNFTNDTDSGTVMAKGTANSTGLKTGNEYNNLTINDGLIGYWKLDETAGTSAADASGYGNTGTHTNDPTISATVPSTNFTNPRSLSFDGADDYINVPHSSSLSITDFITVSAWIRPNTDGESFPMIITKGEINTGYLLFLDQGRIHFRINLAGGYSIVGTTNLAADLWHQVVGTYDGTFLKVFVNGVEETSLNIGSVVIDSNEESLGIGGRESNFFDGLIDDVRIYNRALSAQEIQALAAGNQPATSTATVTLDSNLDVNNNLTLNSGTLDTDSGSDYDITVGGTWENNGGVFTPQDGTVTLDGATAGNELQSGGQNFNNLTVTGAGDWTLHDRLEVDSTYNQSAGTLSTSSNDYNIVANDWDQTAGIFTPNASTLTLNGASNQTINTSSSLYNLQVEDPTEDGLVGYWKLDEGQGTTTRDDSGNGNTGTLTNAPAWSEDTNNTTTYDNPYSMSFDGVDDYVDTGDVLEFESNEPFSVTGWIYGDAFPDSSNTIIGKLDDIGERGWLIAIDSSGKLGNFMRDSGPTYFGETGSTILNTGTWYHIAFTYSGSRTVAGSSLYVNGVRETETTGADALGTATMVNNENLKIGYRTSSFPQPFNGLLDDVRIYDRALSEDEVALLAAGRYADGDSSTATVTLNTPLAVENDLTLQSGILDADDNDISLEGNWNNYSGSSGFDGGTAAVSLTGTDQEINGTTTFSNLEKTEGANNATDETLTFQASTTTTITDTLTLDGRDDSDRINLVSSDPGTPFTIDVTGGPATVDFLDVTDSEASTNDITCTDCNNGGGNDDGEASPHWDFGGANTAPSITAGPSDGSSSSTTPTNAGSNVTFTATATDGEADTYYLAVCKTNAITPNASAAPTCDGDDWAISAATASAAQASVNYTTIAGDVESNAWFAFVCDNNADPLCSASSQGAGVTGSPFSVNHRPTFTSVTSTPTPVFSGSDLTFPSVASDTDTNGTQDTVTLYLCKAADFSGGACGAGGEWTSSGAASSNPTATYTATDADSDSPNSYYAYIIDNHSFQSTSNPRSGTFSVDVPRGGGGGGSNNDTPAEAAEKREVKRLTSLIESLKRQIEELLSAQGQPQQPPTPQTPPTVPQFLTFQKNLQLGDQDPDVKRLQQFLNSHGFKVAETGPGSPNQETTLFGSFTKAALMKLQGAHAEEILGPAGLTNPNGVFGPFTRRWVNGAGESE